MSLKRILYQERKTELSEDTPTSDGTGNDPRYIFYHHWVFAVILKNLSAQCGN